MINEDANYINLYNNFSLASSINWIMTINPVLKEIKKIPQRFIEILMTYM